MEVEYRMTFADWVACFVFLQEQQKAQTKSKWWKPLALIVNSILVVLGVVIVISLQFYSLMVFVCWAFADMAGDLGGPPIAASFRNPVMPLIGAALLDGIFLVVWATYAVWQTSIPNKKQQQRRAQQLVNQQLHAKTLNLDRKYHFSLNAHDIVEVELLRETDGAIERVERKEWRVAWDAISAIQVTEQYILFVMVDGRPLILPRHAFSTEQEVSKFVDAAKRFQTENKERSSATLTEFKPTRTSTTIQQRMGPKEREL